MQWQCCCQSGVLVLLRCIDSKGTHLPRKENSDCLNRFAPPATKTTTRCWLYRRTRCPENARASWASGSFRFQTASAPEKTHSSKVKLRKCIADVCCVQGPFPARICCGFWLVRDLHPVRDHWSSAPREGVYLPRLKHVIDTPLFPSQRRHGCRGFLCDTPQEDSGSKSKQICAGSKSKQICAGETDGCFRAWRRVLESLTV